MNNWGRRLAFLLALWLLLVSAALLFRPLMPVNETRYLAVAWEMWVREDFLVPHLNGAPYSHKPPLLFWLMQTGWGIFGVNEWWPRLVSPVFGLACIFLVIAVCRQLWPNDPGAATVAPLLLIGGLFWSLYTTLAMFDMLVAAFTLVGLLGLLRAWRQGEWSGWALVGLAIGVGILTKGPVVLLYIMPAALLAPWWDTGKAISNRINGWVRWYLGLAASIVIGVAIGLAWAGPAMNAGGEDYANAILWDQTAGRIVNAFDHGQPFWWYLALLPPALLPWILWPALWRAANGAWRARYDDDDVTADSGIRFCLVCIALALVVLSLVSSKQPHYLLPIMPAVALLAARVLSRFGQPGRRWDAVPLSVLVAALLVIGTYLIVSEQFGPQTSLGSAATLLWVLPALTGALWLLCLPKIGPPVIAGLSAVLMVSVHGIARPALEQTHSVSGIAAYIGSLQRAGRLVAHDGKYHGQYHFLGRLEKPLPIVDCDTAPDWLRRNPEGALVFYRRRPGDGIQADYDQRFRAKFVGVWSADKVLAHPEQFVCDQ